MNEERPQYFTSMRCKPGEQLIGLPNDENAIQIRFPQSDLRMLTGCPNDLFGLLTE